MTAVVYLFTMPGKSLLSWIMCLLAVGCGGEVPNTPAPVSLRLETVASGLNSPIHLAAAPGDARLFIVEQAGRIRIVKNGQLLATPFLDIRSRIASGGERGLLSVAFHPSYGSNGFFYVNYTNTNGDSHVERYSVTGNADVADPNSNKLILFVAQPYPNHNGGHIMFGPDGFLYIAMGDGGSGGDPHGHGQNRATVLGDLLRIDVDGGDPYAIPPSNPFVGNTAFRGEIWAWGLRNPWRLAFDRTAGLIYIADVGQSAWEEINAAPANQGGLNYGWRITEGMHCYNASSCNTQGLTLPVVEYDHGGSNCSVTGGLVYRGTVIPEIAGHYFYGDYCSGWIRSFRYSNNQVVDRVEWPFQNVGSLSSFGEDSSGELYVVVQGGTVYRIARN